MSSSNYAVIIVGCPVSLFEDGIDTAEEYGLDVIFPYYDGSPSALAGFLYQETSLYAELDIDVIKINELKNEFRNITGLEAKLYLSNNVV